MTPSSHSSSSRSQAPSWGALVARARHIYAPFSLLPSSGWGWYCLLAWVLLVGAIATDSGAFGALVVLLCWGACLHRGYRTWGGRIAWASLSWGACWWLAFLYLTGLPFLGYVPWRTYATLRARRSAWRKEEEERPTRIATLEREARLAPRLTFIPEEPRQGGGTHG